VTRLVSATVPDSLDVSATSIVSGIMGLCAPAYTPDRTAASGSVGRTLRDPVHAGDTSMGLLEGDGDGLSHRIHEVCGCLVGRAPYESCECLSVSVSVCVKLEWKGAGGKSMSRGRWGDHGVGLVFCEQ
jgi:hypothetical protein